MHYCTDSIWMIEWHTLLNGNRVKFWTNAQNLHRVDKGVQERSQCFTFVFSNQSRQMLVLSPYPKHNLQFSGLYIVLPLFGNVLCLLCANSFYFDNRRGAVFIISTVWSPKCSTILLPSFPTPCIWAWNIGVSPECRRVQPMLVSLNCSP